MSNDFEQWFENYLIRFDQNWSAGLLQQWHQQLQLGMDHPRRRDLVLQMCGIDLQRRWQSGATPIVEHYLRICPELGTLTDVPIELLQGELEARRSLGCGLTIEEVRQRFPHLSADQQQSLLPVCAPSAVLESNLIGNVETSQVNDTRDSRILSGRSVPPISVLPATPDQAHSESGDRYRILSLLGRGGMGVVHVAEDIKLKRIVALKMILPEYANNVHAMERFRREAHAVAQIHHPNAVQIYDVGIQQGQPYCAFELVRGGSLADRLRSERPIPAVAATLVHKMALAMAAVHGVNVLHRDLKPANVLLEGEPHTPLEECEPKITDFGLTKQLDEDQSQTRTGELLGTPAYMAPEQARGDHVSVQIATDVYALGAILYEMLTGQPPFRGRDVRDTLDQVRAGKVVPPSLLQSGIPRDLEAICLKCLQTDPRARYGSADALSEDLSNFCQGKAVQARPIRQWERVWKWAKRQPTVAALITGSIAVPLIILMMLLIFNNQLRRESNRATRWAREAERQRDEAIRQKRQAQLQKQEAEHQRAEASRQRDREAASFRKALAMVQFMSEVARDDLEDIPQVEAVRRKILENALQYYEHFVKERSGDPSLREELADAYYELVFVYANLGQTTSRINALQQAIHLYEEVLPSATDPSAVRRSLAIACNNLGTHHSNSAQPAEAKKYFDRACSVREELLKDPRFTMNAKIWSDHAVTLTNLASVEKELGMHAVCLQHYAEAETIFQKLEKEGVTDSWFVSGRVQFLRSYWLTTRSLGAPGAEKILDRLKSVLRNLVSSRRPLDLLYQLNGLSSVAYDLQRHRRLEEAEKLGRLVLNGRKDLAEQYPKNPQYKSAVAEGHRLLSQIHRAATRRKQALEEIATAIRLYREILSNPEQAGSREYREDLGRCLSTKGALHADAKEWTEAELAYEESKTLRERLWLETNRSNPNYQRYLANAYLQLGQIALSQRGEKARKSLELLEKARGLIAPLTAQELPARLTHGRALRYLAEACFYHGMKEQTIQHNQEAIRDLEFVHERDKAETFAERELFACYVNHAYVLFHVGKGSEAVPFVSKAEKMAGPKEPKRWVELARLYGRCGMGNTLPPEQRPGAEAKCFGYLSKALSAGFRDRGALEEDTFLTHLHTRAEWKELMKRLP